MSIYEYTQRSPLHLLLLAGAAVFALLAQVGSQEPVGRFAMLGAAGLLVFFAACFASLTVRDEGEALALSFGPLPLFGCRIPWQDIESAEVGRTRLIDGWGIHWIPGRGTTFNLWGFDCVVLRTQGKVVQIGTDDAENLAQVIRSRISAFGRIPAEQPDQAVF